MMLFAGRRLKNYSREMSGVMRQRGAKAQPVSRADVSGGLARIASSLMPKPFQDALLLGGGRCL